MLAQIENPTLAAEQIRGLFAARGEWLLAGDFALQPGEIEVAETNGKIILSCLTKRGWQTLRVLAWNAEGEKLIFTVAPKLNSKQTEFEFVPRISTETLREDLNSARLERARELAEIARRELSNRAKIERVGLSRGSRRGQFGATARILLSLPNGKTTAVCGSILEQTNVEKLLSASILWLTKLQERRKIGELWLIAEEVAAENLQKFHALLRDGWRGQIKILKRKDAVMQSAEKEILEVIAPVELAELWREKTKKIMRPKLGEMSKRAHEAMELLPEKIDVVRSKYGETVRFQGLPFLRVRTILGEEKTWFGLDGKKRRILDETSLSEFENLFDNLLLHRRADAEGKKGFWYKSAPESWLESILRRDVSRLDPNLILAPLHAQFRLANKPGALDLLALRTDGRLVVIELKVSPDREHIFQAVNYWRQIELQRRSGAIRRAGLFDDLEIADAPPLVYLVAPLMSFHRDFEILASAVSSEIELWRFDLNENWREEIRVSRRLRVN